MNQTNTKAKWWLMGISILLGGLSAWAIDRHLHDKEAELEFRTRLDQVTLLVASRDLGPDTILEETDVATHMFPEKWAPDDAVSVEQVDVAIGKRLLTEVRAGQPLMHVHLQEVDAPGVSSRLGPDRQAITITLDAGSTSAGLIREGDRVDLYVSFDHQGKRITAGLLQSVEVLTAGQRSQPYGRSELNQSSHLSNDASMTVAISHQEAVKLVAAREAGSISAILSSSDSSNLKPSFRPTSGDLAALLGLNVDLPQRVVPILYGDRLSNEKDYPAEIDMSSETGRLGIPIQHAASFK